MDKALVPYVIVLLAVAVVLIAVTAFLVIKGRVKPGEKKEKSAPHRELGESFRKSLAALREKIPDGDFLYRVPWLLAIGEPGSGKTSLLRQLNGESSGTESSVEWFFLKGGALLDVPGDFLISPSGTASSDGQWRRLLRLLLRYRPHRPIDGIVLTIPAKSLMAQGAIAESQRAGRAAAIREQLDHLQAELRMVVPVQVLIAKCDEIRGFRDFCEQLDPSTNEQLFGWSSSSTLETAFSTDRIDEAFDTLGGRLQELQLELFSRELNGAVDDLFLFPAELENLRSPLKEYLTKVFHETSYVEPNFLRGIYFCGDVLMHPNKVPLNTLPAASGETALTVLNKADLAPDSAPVATPLFNHYQPQVAFIRQFFDLKVFPEAKIARPTRGIRLSRDRGLLMTQAALAIFVVIFAIGTVASYFRLSSLANQRLKPALEILSSRFPQTVEDRKNFSLSAAYDLAELLGVVDVHGFRAFFLPGSWTDPIDSAVGKVLADAFSKRVLISFKSELNARVKAMKGACAPIPPIAQKLPTDIDALAKLNFTSDLEYQALERSLIDMDRLRKAVTTYNDLRMPGNGSFQEMDQLFRFLINKGLDDEARFKHNPYFIRALQEQTAGPVELADALDHRRDLEACMGVETESRVNNFFASWFGNNNPLPALTGGVADEIDELTSAKSHSRDNLRFLVDDVRRLDALLASGEYRWLREAAFNPSNFPALSKGLSSEPFADAAFLQNMTNTGNHAFTELKEDLFSVRTGQTGNVLEDFQGEIQMDPEVNTVASNIDVLLAQDFMAETTASPLLNASQGVIWHKAALQRPQLLMESYDKYLKDNLPLIPAGLRTSIRGIAQEGLRAAVMSAVSRAEEPVNPMSASDAATLMLEIRSLDECLPELTEIASAIGSGAAASSSDLDRLIYNQATALTQQLSTIFKGESLFAPGAAGLAAWDGVRPLSLSRFGVETPDELEAYLAKQRELLKIFVLEYGQPLEKYLQSHRLQDANGPDVWTNLIRDVQDQEANKPGNPLAALDTFIRSGMDKINISNACQPVIASSPSANYFLVLRAKLQKSAVDRCGEILLEQYNGRIARFFNQKLAGRFPFGPATTADERPAADVADTIHFFRTLNEIGTPLMKYLQASNRDSEIYAFLKDADALRQLFAPSMAEESLGLDAKVSFRVNRDAEIKGEQIIDWRIQMGSTSVKPGDPANVLHWSYGTPVTVFFRFAKDSPDVPIQTKNTADAVIEGRSVRYELRNPWSLLSLIEAHKVLPGESRGAPMRSGLLRFSIATLPSSSGKKAQNISTTPEEAKIFIRIVSALQSGTEIRETPIPAFPESAPTLNITSASLAH
jgi:type VI secretion system protein ImpL